MSQHVQVSAQRGDIPLLRLLAHALCSIVAAVLCFHQDKIILGSKVATGLFSIAAPCLGLMQHKMAVFVLRFYSAVLPLGPRDSIPESSYETPIGLLLRYSSILVPCGLIISLAP